MELVARGSVFEVVAILGGEEWKRALEIRAQSQTGMGNNSVRTFSEWREDAQNWIFRGMKQGIVRAGGQSGDGF